MPWLCGHCPGDPVHIAYCWSFLERMRPWASTHNGIELPSKMLVAKSGPSIKFDGQDGGCSAEGGQSAGTALAADPTIVAVIGTSCSSEARVAAPLLSQAGFVIVSPSNTAPDLTEAGNANNFAGYLRTAHNDKVQGAVAAEYVFNELGVTRAATIHDGSLYADKLRKSSRDFTALGGTITAQKR
jgi:branched-chain amino acid transport system substrate-binding protein